MARAVGPEAELASEVCRNPWLLVTEPTTLFAIEMFGQGPALVPGLART